MNGGNNSNQNDGRGSHIGGRNGNSGGSSSSWDDRNGQRNNIYIRNGGRIYPNSALYTPIDLNQAGVDDNDMINGGADLSNNNGRRSGRGGRSSNGGGRSGGRGNFISSRSHNSNRSDGGRIYPDSFWHTPHDPHLTGFIDNERVLSHMMTNGNGGYMSDGRGRGRGRRSSSSGGINGSRGGRSRIRDYNNRNDLAGFADNRHLFRPMMNGGDVRRSNRGRGNGEGARSRNGGGSSSGGGNISDGGTNRNGRGVHEHQRRGPF